MARRSWPLLQWWVRLARTDVAVLCSSSGRRSREVRARGPDRAGPKAVRVGSCRDWCLKRRAGERANVELGSREEANGGGTRPDRPRRASRCPRSGPPDVVRAQRRPSVAVSARPVMADVGRDPETGRDRPRRAGRGRLRAARTRSMGSTRVWPRSGQGWRSGPPSCHSPPWCCSGIVSSCGAWRSTSASSSWGYGVPAGRTASDRNAHSCAPTVLPLTVATPPPRSTLAGASATRWSLVIEPQGPASRRRSEGPEFTALTVAPMCTHRREPGAMRTSDHPTNFPKQGLTRCFTTGGNPSA